MSRIAASDLDDAYCVHCQEVFARVDLIIDFDLRTSLWTCPECGRDNETHHFAEGLLVA